MALNVTTAVFAENCNTATASPSLAQWDTEQVLQISGIDLPDSYKVEFSTVYTRNAIPAIGDASGVAIPNVLLQRSAPITAYVVLYGENGGRNREYWITIYITPGQPPETITPDPEQADVIDEAIAALNNGVARTEAAAGEAEAASQAVQDMGVEAETLAEGAAASVEKTVDPETGAVTLRFGLPKGEKGNPGKPGADGTTPNFRIGTVTTLPPESPAEATITGTKEAPALNLGIPQGKNGEPGQGGGAVESVNGKTGAVVLNASDVGALPDNYQAPVRSVAGKTGAVTLGAGDVGYSESETYQSGTAGHKLSELSRQLSDVGSAMTNKADNSFLYAIEDSGTGKYIRTNGTVVTDTRFYYTYTTIIPCEPGYKFIYRGGSYVAASVLYYNNGAFVSGASYGAETEVTIPSGVNGVRFQSAKLTEVSLDVERIYPITFDVISEANGKPIGALWQNTENGPAWVSNEIASENPFYQKLDFVTLFDDESKYSLVSDDNIIYLSGIALPQNAFIKTVRFKASASGSGYIAIASTSVIASRYLWNVKLYPVEYSEGWNEVTINFSTDGNTDYLIGHLKLKVLYGDYTTLSGTVDTKYMFGGGNYYQSNSTNIIYENVRYAFGSVGSNYKCCMAFDAEIYTGTYPEDHDKINKTSNIFTGELLPKYEVIPGEIGYVGRWYDYNDGDSTFKIASADGAYVCFKLSGATSISIQWGGSFIANSYISYRIDNSALTRLLVDSTGNTISIPDTDKHIVQIVMDAINVTNTWYTQGNGIGIKGITTSGTLKAIQPKNRKIIFFGDSLTRGVRALGEETEEEPNCNSSVKSYAWYMSQRLDATPILVGYGSSGVVASGEFGNCMTAINYVAQNIESADLDVDLIVINHGHNDVSVPSQNFKTAYNAVLDRFMTKYPGVPVMCVSPFNNVHSADIKECAESKSWCYFVDTYSLYLDRYYADGPGHLTAQGAEICGAYLANETKW